jgi:SAM-dependent methyltransferase
MDQYYDEGYFNYQREQGLFAAELMYPFYQEFIKPSDAVLDFGSGGGFLLNKISCDKKNGIEINEYARKNAAELGIQSVASIDEVENNWADVLISCHALEHTLRPYDILVQLYSKLKTGGRVIFIVPHETKYKYNSADINKHMYTWSEMNIGNLFAEAGFSIIESKELLYRFPPRHQKMYKLFGKNIFNKMCRIYAVWARYRHMTQIRLIAEKK